MGPLMGCIRETKPDIVHSRNWGTMEGILAGYFTRSCATVYSEHGMESAAPESLIRRGFRRLIYQLSDHVFSVSSQLRDHHARATGFPPHRIGVIHNGVELDRFRASPASREKMREQLGLGPEEICVGVVGRLEPVKDTITVLQAAATLSPLSKWRVVIAGDGTERASLQQFAGSRPDLAKRVHFIGETQQVPELLNAFDIYVLPSLSEGISNSLLEAMATGLPVIASAVGGTPEVVVDGVSGILFPAGNTERLRAELLRLLFEKGSRDDLGRQALERVRKHFSVEAMLQNYERLYRGLSERRKRAPLAA